MFPNWVYWLEYNHYPPVKATPNLIAACQEAIRACEEGEPDRQIDCGLTAGQIVEELHLGQFVDRDIEDAGEEL